MAVSALALEEACASLAFLLGVDGTSLREMVASLNRNGYTTGEAIDETCALLVADSVPLPEP